MKVNAWSKIIDLFSINNPTCRACAYFYDRYCDLGEERDIVMDCPALVAWMDENEVKEDDLT